MQNHQPVVHCHHCWQHMICEAEEVKFETNLVQFPSDSKPENLEIDDYDRSILHHHHPSMYTSLSRFLDKKRRISFEIANKMFFGTIHCFCYSSYFYSPHLHEHFNGQLEFRTEINIHKKTSILQFSIYERQFEMRNYFTFPYCLKCTVKC